MAIKTEVEDFLPVGQRVIFSAYESNYGSELWISDGTPNDSRMLADIYEGTDSSYPADFYYAQGSIWFTAGDSQHGRELWVYDLQTERYYLPMIGQ